MGVEIVPLDQAPEDQRQRFEIRSGGKRCLDVVITPHGHGLQVVLSVVDGLATVSLGGARESRIKIEDSSYRDIRIDLWRT